jgi:hypothetical protein
MKLVMFTPLFCSSAECYSSAATAPRRRSQRPKHRPGHHDQVHATHSEHLPSALLLLRQCRVAASSGLSTGLSTTIKYLRRTASGAAENGLGTTIKYLPSTRNGAAGNGLGSTIKYL